MKLTAANETAKEVFETWPVPRALAKMAIPTIISQLIALVYNVADTWFIGQTDNPYMVAASALVLTVFLMTTGIANLFGVGGGSLVVRLLGRNDEDEAKKVASLSLVMAAVAAAMLFYQIRIKKRSAEDLLVNRLARQQAEETGTEAAEAISETPECAEAPEKEEDEPHGDQD